MHAYKVHALRAALQQKLPYQLTIKQLHFLSLNQRIVRPLPYTLGRGNAGALQTTIICNEQDSKRPKKSDHVFPVQPESSMLFSIFGTGSPSLLHLQQQANNAQAACHAARNPGVGMSDVTAVCCVTTWWSSCISSAEGMTTHKPLPVLYSFSYNLKRHRCSCLVRPLAHCGILSGLFSNLLQNLTVEQHCRGWRFPGQAKGQRGWGRGP